MMKLKNMLAIMFAVSIVYMASLSSCKAAKPNGHTKLVAWVRATNNYVKPPNDILEAVHQKILEDTGVDLQIVVGPVGINEFNTKLHNALAAGEQIDIVQVGNIKTYYDQGMLADLTEALNKYGSDVLKLQGQENMAQVFINGSYYGVPRDVIAGNTYPIWIRGDWLEKYNLGLPTTIEEFENMLKIFAENDPSGNGTTIPLMTNGVTGCIMTLSAAWLDYGYNDLYGQFIDSDGRLLPSIIDSGFKNYLETLYRWYQKGYLLKDNYFLPSADQLDMIKAGRVGAWAGWYSFITNYEGTMQLNYPDAHYVELDLKGPKGFSQSFGYSGSDYPAAYVVFNRCKDVDAAVRVLNWGYINDNFIYSKYATYAEVEYIDGVYYYTVINDPIGDEYQSLYRGLVNESRFLLKGGDSLLQRHYDYLAMRMVDFRYGKFPFTKGIRFERNLLTTACPTLPDINRMLEENLLAFLIGNRPLSEYDNFVNELFKLGFDRYIYELTRQFNEQR